MAMSKATHFYPLRNRMKLKATLAALAMLGMAAPVFAQDLDFSKIKCKEFVSAPKDQIGTILVWLEGYYAKENDPRSCIPRR